MIVHGAANRSQMNIGPRGWRPTGLEPISLWPLHPTMWIVVHPRHVECNGLIGDTPLNFALKSTSTRLLHNSMPALRKNPHGNPHVLWVCTPQIWVRILLKRRALRPQPGARVPAVRGCHNGPNTSVLFQTILEKHGAPRGGQDGYARVWLPTEIFPRVLPQNAMYQSSIHKVMQ